MILSLSPAALREYVQRQVAGFFPDGREDQIPAASVDEALGRLHVCFDAVADRSFSRGGETLFNHLHGDQYAMFLYLLSNTLHRAGAPTPLSEKLFGLNKALYGIDAFYEVELPEIFLFCHASGTVLGRAQYADYFLVYQHCTVGSARAEEGAGRGVFPVLGRHTSLYVGAAVLGASTLGENCKVAANSVVLDRILEPNTVYRGTPQSFQTATRTFPDNVWKK